MNAGVLWFDNDKNRTLEEKVARAVIHYKQKYGEMPTTCFVNPSLLDSGTEPEIIAGVFIRAAKTVIPHHFWLGVEEIGEYAPFVVSPD